MIMTITSARSSIEDTKYKLRRIHPELVTPAMFAIVQKSFIESLDDMHGLLDRIEALNKALVIIKERIDG